MPPPSTRPPPPRPAAEPWHLRTPEQAFAHFHTSAEGLSSAEAARRLTADGPNTLATRAPDGWFHLLAAQFNSLLIWLLLVAGAISAALGETVDASAIFAIVAINAAVGFYQEYSARQSLGALRKLTAPLATVRRDGKLISVPAASIVTGDILSFEAGDVVAADARLITSANLRCNEASLTGEAGVVPKQSASLAAGDIPLAERATLVFQGTGVAVGTGLAVVVATGMQTELGAIAALLDPQDADAPTPLQRKLDTVARQLVWAAAGIVGLHFALGLWRGTALIDLFMTSVSLAVAAVPEGLPTIVTVALSLGVLRMARRRALVRKLAAVETLGTTSIICTDKTGTLTLGQMTVRALYAGGQRFDVSGEGYGPEGTVLLKGLAAVGPSAAALLELAEVLVAGNQAQLSETAGTWSILGDPTEGALLTAAAKIGVTPAKLNQTWPVRHTLPFDSERKRSAVVRALPGGGLRVFSLGAPGPLLDSCTHLATPEGVRPLTADDRAGILAETATWADASLRVLAASQRDLPRALPEDLVPDTLEKNLIFIGLAGMYDPPRPEARAAIATCHDAGIRVVMITGDHPRTAAAIARELGIPAATTVTGTEVEAWSDPDLRVHAASICVYARVTAGQKLRIVRALKAGDAVVAMTGDGVNDAPALQGADIGIAMGITGTEVTKEVADIVITDDHFATIVSAVEQGRGIYNNIRKTLQYLLAGNTGELLVMAACVALGLPAPLLPIHLLWINLVTDGLPALCLATDTISPDVMKRQPRARSAQLTDRTFVGMMVLTGTLTAGVTLVTYLRVLSDGTLAEARTAAFAVLVFAELLRAFGARSETRPIWNLHPFANWPLLVVVVVSIGLQFWSQQASLLGRLLKSTTFPFADGLALLALGAVPLLVLELLKVVRRRHRLRQAHPYR